MKIFFSIFTILLSDRSAVRFVVGAVLGLSFSLSVVLLTIGVMDGFEYTLKKGLQQSEGDVILYSRDGFFNLDDRIKTVLKRLQIKDYSPLLQSEGLVVHGNKSHGTLVRGVDGESFSKVTGLTLSLQSGEIALGSELMANLQVGKGDMVALALASSKSGTASLLKQFKVVQMITHGVYKKDLRLAYLRRDDLQQFLGIYKINMITMNIPGDNHQRKVEQMGEELEDHLGGSFSSIPYWQGFSSLLEAVKVEKFMIALILQLIVIISAVNVLALVIFFNEKKSRELFLFRALGMAQAKIFKIWQLLIAIIWFGSCMLSILWVALVNGILEFLPFLKVPAKVYSVSKFPILLDYFDYGLVFSLGLLWPFVLSLVGLAHLKRKSILQGLRREFA
ncbi:MAG: hypothetical protein OXB84_00305 [Halobacteriovoraceae bacterium]|nr:hypothetical protein [Halobacteriovoraceae bacterium]